MIADCRLQNAASWGPPLLMSREAEILQRCSVRLVLHNFSCGNVSLLPVFGNGHYHLTLHLKVSWIICHLLYFLK